MTLFQILLHGGPIFFILLVCSILSIAIIIQKFMEMRRIKKETLLFMESFMDRVRKGQFDTALELCRESRSPACGIFQAALERRNKPKDYITDAVDRRSSEFTGILDNRLAILATLGNMSPFVGLFGTVLGITNAFRSIANIETFSPALVTGGIAEALVNTAAGLFVAIPAVIFFNYFNREIEVLMSKVDVRISELIEIIQR
jgi:biopolymer transport protein ExbB/TolQ